MSLPIRWEQRLHAQRKVRALRSARNRASPYFLTRENFVACTRNPGRVQRLMTSRCSTLYPVCTVPAL